MLRALITMTMFTLSAPCSALTKEQARSIETYLYEICPDTFCAGDLLYSHIEVNYQAPFIELGFNFVSSDHRHVLTKEEFSDLHPAQRIETISKNSSEDLLFLTGVESQNKVHSATSFQARCQVSGSSDFEYLDYEIKEDLVYLAMLQCAEASERLFRQIDTASP